MFYQMFATYSFHDTKIDDIEILSDGIVLLCNEGLNLLTHNPSDGNKTPSCKVKICIDNFDSKHLLQNLEIKKSRKNKTREIEFNLFSRLLKKDAFKVYFDYYCYFSRSIKLEGVSNSFYFSLTISDINKLEVIYLSNPN